MIEVTVALPMLRAEHIGWLALESLCRQKNLSDMVAWELLVAEETGPEYEPFGKEEVFSYEDRLRKVNCQRIEYIGLDRWIPLSRKWKLLAERASDTSKIFALQAADCYSQPYRLYETYQLFEEGVDWVQSPKGIFYNIADEKTILFNHENYPEPRHPCGLNMAIRMPLVKKLPGEEVVRSVDKWLFKKCTTIKGSELNVRWNRNDTWKFGIDTNGVNNITRRLNNFICPEAPFERCDIDVSDCLPQDIMQRLKECKRFCPDAPNHEVMSLVTTYLNPKIGFNDLQSGYKVKIKGRPGEDGEITALTVDVDISTKAPADEAVIEGLIRSIDHQKNTLRLLNREFVLPAGIEINDLHHNIIGLKDLKVGDWVKLKGKHSQLEGFVPEKINMKKIMGSQFGRLQGAINKIDRENKTFDLLGFTVKVIDKPISF